MFTPLPFRSKNKSPLTPVNFTTGVFYGRAGECLYTRVSYTVGMSSEVTFQLDPKGGEDILQSMAAGAVKQSAEAIAARAQGMASSMSHDPPTITVTTSVGTIRRGVRAIGTVTATGKNAHQDYIGSQALVKSKDAGRVN